METMPMSNTHAPRLRGWRGWAAALSCAVVLAACGDAGSPSSTAGTGGNPGSTVTELGSVSGIVTSMDTGAPLANVQVSLPNATATTQTDAQGNYTLTGVPVASRAVLRFNAPGYAEGLAVAAVTANATSQANGSLQRAGGTASGPATSPLTVTVTNSPAQVALSANSVVRADGTAPSGNVTATLSVVNPALNVNAMPGDYQVSTANGIAQMESWGAINVSLADAAGARLNLASGKTATIRIPVATRNAEVPATIPLFFFNESIGLWVQEGSAALAGTAPNQYYEGTVTHFSYWNADRVTESVYVNGCVASGDGASATRVAGVRVTSDGIDYSGGASAVTDANGNFRVAIKKDARAVIAGQQGNKLTNSVSAGPFSTDITLPACLSLSALTDAITIKLTWGQSPSDVDSHLFAPDGTHVYYSSKGSLTSDPYANLDVDDTTSYGPEVVTLRKLMVGTYTYALRNYSRTYQPGMTDSPVRVELNRGSSMQVFTPGPGETTSTDWWTAFTMTVDAQCNVTVTPVNTWTQPSPTPVARQYCVKP